MSRPREASPRPKLCVGCAAAPGPGLARAWAGRRRAVQVSESQVSGSDVSSRFVFEFRQSARALPIRTIRVAAAVAAAQLLPQQLLLLRSAAATAAAEQGRLRRRQQQRPWRRLRKEGCSCSSSAAAAAAAEPQQQVESRPFGEPGEGAARSLGGQVCGRAEPCARS
jgi:hypothetical protein